MLRFAFFIVFLVFCLGSALGQSNTDEPGFYLFEPEKFSLPVKDMIAHYEGFPATPFMANNMDGKELFMGDFKGKTLILYFWNTTTALSMQVNEEFNQLVEFYGQEKLEIVSFADDDRATVNSFLDSFPVKFHTIPNSKVFSEMAYSADLGYPRAFIIDEFGIIKKVIPREAFERSSNGFEMMKSLLSDIM